ncbi:MAG: geranylgeranylglycerol-phosphate geranylgeranyltransferase [Flavobacteriaceae bacterium]
MITLIMVLTRYALIHPFLNTLFSTLHFILLAISILCITIGGYIINDIFDVEIDHINKPNKVYVNQTIGIRSAWYNYIGFTIIGILIGIYVSKQIDEIYFSLIFIGSFLVLYIYSKYFKRYPLIGNITVAFMGSLVIYLIYLFETTGLKREIGFLNILSRIFSSVTIYVFLVYYISFSFLTTLVREIIKDIIDINGDYHVRMKTLPILLGIKRTKAIAIIVTLLLFVLACLITNDFFYSSSNIIAWYFLICIILPLAYFIYVLWSAEKKKDFIFLSSFMKVIMLFGILSMLLVKF